jgi:protein TonB
VLVDVRSPFVLATAGTLAIHVLLAVAGDAVVVTHPLRGDTPAPRIDLVDVEVPPVQKPPPPPIEQPKASEPLAKPAAMPTPQRVRAAPPKAAPPPPETTAPTDPGGAPVVQMDDLAPGATGTVPVAIGAHTTGHVGRGGMGTGTGSGTGTGTQAAASPMSVATIKSRAMPRGDYGYVSTKEYPQEAKQLGIEGAIRVRLIVDEHGKVASAVLLNKLGYGLDELALARAKAIEFEPARDSDDRPVNSVVVWTFNMTLPK